MKRAPTDAAVPRRRRPLRWLLRALLAAAAGWGLAIVLGMPPSAPIDIALNLGPGRRHDDLRADPGAPAPLVVLQHGLLRSAWSLWKLERALRAHGYEVLNPSYPSTTGTIEQHAERLAAELLPRLGGGDARPPLAFVGHSTGGLVIRCFLAEHRELARGTRCVFLGVPHRGAQSASTLSQQAWFGLLLGRKAAWQLRREDAFFATDRWLPDAVIGNVVGGRGDDAGWSDIIDGDDDGRVGVAEARSPDQDGVWRLRVGHTRITTDDEVVRLVLTWLRHGRFGG